ncbi:MAG: pyridoxamine 5'-phosphate oxidase [Candidatus Omnitrophica bacterium]|nr:pyridoxamine 5'-phosphate oxidase [Candidatus Omnitrophota bacterium]
MTKDKYSESTIKKTLRTLRRAVHMSGLNETEAGDDPIVLFEKWIAAAVEKESFEPNSMVLATASKDGHPTARTVLLKDYGPEGFVFYTNYDSRKGLVLTENPQASLVFYWGVLMRQVLIDGVVTRTGRATSEDYFHSRPRGSQLAAYVSAQSRPVKDRKVLTDAMKTAEAEFKGQEIPCPEEWGGYCLQPRRIEFWQGRPDRMHDRLCYTHRDDGTWKRERLAP